ncbi:hypothetical protein MSIM_12560 [Mycobacterium simiae]|nr:hypothetical protein MSIM_12560 [Mycobacterium simiae]
MAVKQLEAIDQLLDEMNAAKADVSVYRRYFPHWCRAVFVFPHGWEAQVTEDLPDGILDHLQNLAEMLRYYVPTVTPDGLAALGNYVATVKAALEDDGSIPDPLRIHVLEVIEHLSWCVEKYDDVGDFLLAEAVERLAATVIRAAAGSADKGKWRTVMDTFIWPFTVNVMAAIPGQALTMLALG